MPKYIVRHGVMRQLGVFTTRSGETYARSQKVIARTHRGIEVGEVLCEATEQALSQMPNGNHDGNREEQKPKNGQILHLQSEEDTHEAQKLFEQERSEYEICLKRIAE